MTVVEGFNGINILSTPTVFPIRPAYRGREIREQTQIMDDLLCV